MIKQLIWGTVLSFCISPLLSGMYDDVHRNMLWFVLANQGSNATILETLETNTQSAPRQSQPNQSQPLYGPQQGKGKSKKGDS